MEDTVNSAPGNAMATRVSALQDRLEALLLSASDVADNTPPLPTVPVPAAEVSQQEDEELNLLVDQAKDLDVKMDQELMFMNMYLEV
jgi:hypothetical protein